MKSVTLHKPKQLNLNRIFGGLSLVFMALSLSGSFMLAEALQQEALKAAAILLGVLGMHFLSRTANSDADILDRISREKKTRLTTKSEKVKESEPMSA